MYVLEDITTLSALYYGDHFSYNHYCIAYFLYVKFMFFNIHNHFLKQKKHGIH